MKSTPLDPRDDADARLLGALAHPLRVHLLRQLRSRPCCVSVLTEESRALQPAVSRHLGVLREAGLVTCEVEGRRRCYRLARPELVGALLDLLDAHRPAPSPGDPAPSPGDHP